MKDTDLNNVMEQLLKMIRRVIGEQIEVEFVPYPSLGNVCGDCGQLEQVFVNLCVNARDAMPNGGRLTIVLKNVTLNGAFCEAHPWAQLGRYAQINLSDTGSGMDKKTLTRIFEPFFTTKQMNKGTGLGLAVVHGIIQQHEGFVHVQSDPGHGTTFSIYLPIVERRSSAANTGGTAVKAKPGFGTVLLVEDEPGVLELANTVLQQANYRVLTATNGVEAVQVFQDHAVEIDLVLMDVMMPKLNGPEAYARMVAIRPGVPVLYCSGYSADMLQSNFAPGAELQIIHKPYHPDYLLERMASLLPQK
jgi:CheY-like chemotaxis protein